MLGRLNYHAENGWLESAQPVQWPSLGAAVKAVTKHPPQWMVVREVRETTPEALPRLANNPLNTPMEGRFQPTSSGIHGPDKITPG